MECKFCHAAIDDDATFCPVCGRSLTEDAEAPAAERADDFEKTVSILEDAAPEAEAAAEEAVEAAAEDASAASEEVPADSENAPAEEIAPVTEDELIPGDPWGKPKKRSGGRIALLAILGLLVAGIAVCGVWLSKQAKLPGERTVLSGAVSYTVENDAMTDALAQQVVASSKKNNLFEQAKTTLGLNSPSKDGLTNAKLALYYWENFYNYYNQNYYYAMYLGLDPGHMDTSMYDEEGKRSWQEYFLSNALEDYRTYTAACAKAKEEGFVIPEDIQKNLDQIRESIASRSDEELNAQLLSVYGPGVTRKEYLAYLEELFLGASYIQELRDRIEPTDEELSAYYDAHVEEYADIPKDDSGTVNVRHILIAPEDTEQAESWATAEKTAQELYESWKSGEATEDSFAALAKEHSADPGSAENGGLYEEVAPGTMVAEFNDWCFDNGRKPGDTGIVQTQFGYHVMYFVGEGDYLRMTVRGDYLNDRLNTWVAESVEANELIIYYSKIVLGEVESQSAG